MKIKLKENVNSDVNESHENGQICKAIFPFVYAPALQLFGSLFVFKKKYREQQKKVTFGLNENI